MFTGVCLSTGGCLVWGLPALGGPAPRGCLVWGCLLPGDACSGGCLLSGGACSQGVPAPRGGLFPRGAWSGGACSWGMPALRGCLLPGGCLVQGRGACFRGVPAAGGHLLWGVPALGVSAPGRCLVETPLDGHCCGQYTSHWNAFLFFDVLAFAPTFALCEWVSMTLQF